jgi:hypothetical protein
LSKVAEVAAARQTVPESTRAERIRANGLINSWVRRGRIVRPKHCETCGCRCKPDGHHRDYSQPEMVVWLCRSCHMAEHQRPFPPRKYPISGIANASSAALLRHPNKLGQTGGAA